MLILHSVGLFCIKESMLMLFFFFLSIWMEIELAPPCTFYCKALGLICERQSQVMKMLEDPMGKISHIFRLQVSEWVSDIFKRALSSLGD